jgi:hypothetical protein
MAFLTTTGSGELSQRDGQAIRQWLENGGVIWIDAAGGFAEASDKATQMLQAIEPNAVTLRIERDHPILSGEGLRDGYDNRRVVYRRYTLRRTGPFGRPRLTGVDVNNRLAIIFSDEDITCGLAGLAHWGINGYSPTSARKLALNSALWVASGAHLKPTTTEEQAVFPGLAPIAPPATNGEAEQEPAEQSNATPAEAASATEADRPEGAPDTPAADDADAPADAPPEEAQGPAPIGAPEQAQPDAEPAPANSE